MRHEHGRKYEKKAQHQRCSATNRKMRCPSYVCNIEASLLAPLKTRNLQALVHTALTPSVATPVAVPVVVPVVAPVIVAAAAPIATAEHSQ